MNEHKQLDRAEQLSELTDGRLLPLDGLNQDLALAKERLLKDNQLGESAESLPLDANQLKLRGNSQLR